jgi:hypothetical protein
MGRGGVAENRGEERGSGDAIVVGVDGAAVEVVV